jgi:predicted secreted protein
MSASSAFAIYFIIWWIVLFAVLPWGISSQHEHGDIAPGTDPGAPVLPRLGIKLIWTTVVSGAVFAVFYLAYTQRWLSIDDLAGLLGQG